MVERNIRRCALCAIIGLDERALTRGFRLVVCMHSRNKGTNTVPDWSSSIGQWMMELHRQWHGAPDKSKDSEAKILDSVASGNPPCKEWLPSLMDYVKCTDASGTILRNIAHCAKVFAPSSATGVRLLGKVFMDRLNFMLSRVEGIFGIVALLQNLRSAKSEGSLYNRPCSV